MKILKVVFLTSFLFLVTCFSSCKSSLATSSENEDKTVLVKPNYRQEMRSFVVNMSKYAKSKNPKFGIIPQNGIELISNTDSHLGSPNMEYLNAIDAHGQENLFYGYNSDNKKTPNEANTYLIDYLKVSQAKGNSIFVIDYCSSKDKIANSYSENSALGFVSFSAIERNLTVVPPVSHNRNTNNIEILKDAQNFLFFLNYEDFLTKNQVVQAISNSDYDVVFIDLFFNDGTPFTSLNIEQMKTKANGGNRLVYCYMSIGEAEDYRFYWNKNWNPRNLGWLDKENKNWPGNYKVKYWNKEWQNIIFGNPESYLDKIIGAGYDGVYLDIIDAFEYFENQ